MSIFQIIIIHETIWKWMLLYWMYTTNEWKEREKNRKAFLSTMVPFSMKIYKKKTEQQPKHSMDERIEPWQCRLSMCLCVYVWVWLSISWHTAHSTHTHTKLFNGKIDFSSFFCIILHRKLQCYTCSFLSGSRGKLYGIHEYV